MEPHNFSVQIPFPCQQPWNKMIPTDNGRHCDACNLVVVDFTSMSTEEVKSYFQHNCGKKVCGRFLENQLGDNKAKSQSRIHRILNIRTRFPIASLFLWIAGILFLSGCMAQRSKRVIIGDVAPVENIKHDSTPVK